MKDFWIRFSFLLDANDHKNFLKFLGLLFCGGLLSLLGIGVIIPFINILIDPNYLSNTAFIKAVNLGHKEILGLTIIFLILSFWLKNITAFLVLKKQVSFLGGLVAKIQKKLFHSYLHFPYSYHIKCSSPELINNINVEIFILSNTIAQFGTLLNEGVTSCIIILALLIINPVFSLIVVAAIFITAFFFIKKIRHKINYFGNIRSQSHIQLTQSVIQGLGGIKETKIYQKEYFFIAKVSNYADNIAEADGFASVFQQCPRFLVESILVSVVLSLMLLFIYTGYTSSQMLVLISIFGIAAIQLLPSVNRLLQSLAHIKYGYPSLNKIYLELNKYELFKQSSPMLALENPLQFPVILSKAIHLKNISFSYEDKVILKNINLTIPKNKKIALIGTSGAGKTTLLNIVLGILSPSSGQLYVDETEITATNLPMWFKHFGYIPEMIYIYETTIRENIAFGVDPSHIDEEKVWHCLEMASLSTFVKEKCKAGLNTSLGENGINLSGGQRQRIGIARALYHDPSILVMDEATASLDHQTELAITQALDKASQGRTIITIAHRLSTIKDYDMIHLIEKGEIICSGRFDDLSQQSKAFQHLAGIRV
ncbi:MAG: ABC transporter ATP-binding protein [Gammaproteobacteria bacterium]|nr:ABC transporter ATP-binding protein [Gammaproteobacteria bacterium]